MVPTRDLTYEESVTFLKTQKEVAHYLLSVPVFIFFPSIVQKKNREIIKELKIERTSMALIAKYDKLMAEWLFPVACDIVLLRRGLAMWIQWILQLVALFLLYKVIF